MPPLSHLTSYIHAKYKLYLSNSLAAAVINLPYTGAYHSTYQISCPIFRYLFRIKVSIQVQGKCSCFVTKPLFYGEEFSILRPTPMLDYDHLSGVCNCLFNIFVATLHIADRFSIRNMKKPMPSRQVHTFKDFSVNMCHNYHGCLE